MSANDVPHISAAIFGATQQLNADLRFLKASTAAHWQLEQSHAFGRYR
jgi:hypothetical protein